jgi:hypothetical protein
MKDWTGWDNSKCACVHSDSVECARRRDGLDPDDEHYERRECECCCHESDEEDYDL